MQPPSAHKEEKKGICVLNAEEGIGGFSETTGSGKEHSVVCKSKKRQRIRIF